MSTNIRHRARPVLAAGGSSTTSVFSDDDFGKKRCPPLLKNNVWLFIMLLYFSIFSFALYCDLTRFPSPVSVASLESAVSSRGLSFSEERAKNFVNELSSIGPKPTGSYENEVLAVDYITRQLHYIQSHAKPFNKIEIDLQKSSGCFSLPILDGMVTCYQDVKNIVVKIGPKKSTNKSLLINCHYDSVPTSPGASDDLVSCALMLEVLISLSQHDQALPNDVIFLFNGAEENILQASHGFITQHPWAKTVVGFVNMDACGSGGKQMLFQADRQRTWLLMAYANNTPYPQGSVVAQDIFQNGLVPSDTDYRIFSQHGKIPGLDFAYVKNGYVYHTKYDVPQAITVGGIQQAGLNLINLIHNALNSPDMTKVEEQSKIPLVFFDFMGIFMVVYRIEVATALNFLILFLSFADMLYRNHISGISLKTRIKLVLKAFLVYVGTLVGAIVFCGIIATTLSLFNATMSWYRTPQLIVGLYGYSSIAAIIALHSLSVRKDESLRTRWLQEDVYFDAARVIWMILLLTLELAKLNSSFICCAWVLFPTVIRGLFGNMLNLIGSKGTHKTHLLVHFSMQIIPLSLLLYCVWSMYTVFVPIMGRIGVMVNPDLLIGIFTTLLVFLASSYTMSLVQVMYSTHKILAVVLFIFATTFAIVCFTPLGFPYSGDTESPVPMRLYVLHTERTFYNKSGSSVSADSGYWVIPLDYNGPKMLKSFVEEMKDIEPLDCDAELACGMPFYMPVMNLLRLSYYIPAAKPKVHGNHKFELISKILLNPNAYQLTFRATGTDHQTVIMSPRPGVTLSKWSLTEEPPLQTRSWVDRPAYFIYYSYGEYKEPWTFSIDLTVTQSYVKDDPLIDVSFITHYLHGHDQMTSDFPSFFKRIPSWVHATPWTCTLDMHVF